MQKTENSAANAPPEPIDIFSYLEDKENEITDYAAPYFKSDKPSYEFTSEESAEILKAECKKYYEAMEKMKASSDIYDNFIWYLFRDGGLRKPIDYDYWIFMGLFVVIPTIFIGYFTCHLPNTIFFSFLFKLMIVIYLIVNALSVHIHSAL